MASHYCSTCRHCKSSLKHGFKYWCSKKMNHMKKSEVCDSYCRIFKPTKSPFSGLEYVISKEEMSELQDFAAYLNKVALEEE